MAISTQRAAAARLREAVAAYRVEHKEKLDQSAIAVLDSLAASPNAAEICGRLNFEEASFLEVCLSVEQVARAFRARILAEEKMPERLNRLDKAVAELRWFIIEQTTPSPDVVLRPWLGFADGVAKVETMTGGLDLIAKLIERRRRAKNEVATKIGATRDKHHKEAANNAAIWHLADAVCRATGKPHRKEVAELTHLILKTNVGVDRVDYVVRTRK
jgi:hypothetical protein